MGSRPRVEIEYCSKCKWMLRAASTTSASTAGPSGRARDSGFPEIKILKQRVRDIVAPGRDLGHIDGRKEEP